MRNINPEITAEQRVRQAQRRFDADAKTAFGSSLKKEPAELLLALIFDDKKTIHEAKAWKKMNAALKRRLNRLHGRGETRPFVATNEAGEQWLFYAEDLEDAELYWRDAVELGEAEEAKIRPLGGDQALARRLRREGRADPRNFPPLNQRSQG
jgi:hypothetical protein